MESDQLGVLLCGNQRWWLLSSSILHNVVSAIQMTDHCSNCNRRRYIFYIMSYLTIFWPRNEVLINQTNFLWTEQPASEKDKLIKLPWHWQSFFSPIGVDLPAVVPVSPGEDWALGHRLAKQLTRLRVRCLIHCGVIQDGPCAPSHYYMMTLFCEELTCYLETRGETVLRGM